MSHSLVSSGRVDLAKRLVTGMAPIAIALMSEMHPVSEDSNSRAAGNQVDVACHSMACGKASQGGTRCNTTVRLQTYIPFFETFLSFSRDFTR